MPPSRRAPAQGAELRKAKEKMRKESTLPGLLLLLEVVVMRQRMRSFRFGGGAESADVDGNDDTRLLLLPVGWRLSRRLPHCLAPLTIFILLLLRILHQSNLSCRLIRPCFSEQSLRAPPLANPVSRLAACANGKSSPAP